MKIEAKDPITVLLMENVLKFDGDLEYIFDLKGSWVARKSDPSEGVKKDENLKKIKS